MCPSPTVPLALSALALVGLLACHSDPVSSPNHEGTAPAQLGLGGSNVLLVDNDRADCPRADFTSIQAAVDAAEPGSTIRVCAGIYNEQVTITKNKLRLLAKGQPGDVVLDGLDDHHMVAGFLLHNAHGNLVKGFLVRNYHEAGILLVESRRNTIRKNVTTGSPFHDGIQLFNSRKNVVEHNTSFANFSPDRIACGINVIGPLSTGNIVRHNETFENDFGIQVVGGASHNTVFHNESHNNRRFGIRTVGGSAGTVIENNRSLDNTGPGIALLGSTGVTVVRNRAFGNAPDLFWDGSGTNKFKNNHCRTSDPPGLCEHTEGASKE